MGLSRKQSTSNLQKNDHFLLPDTRTHPFLFLETHFEIHPFTLLPSTMHVVFPEMHILLLMM